MSWTSRTGFIVLAGCLAASCAGTDFAMPEISEAERAEAVQETVAAPRLTFTTRTMAENERLALLVARRLQAAAAPVCAITDRGRCWYTLQFLPVGQISASISKNHIRVTNGLAQYLHTEDEFAAVLAHEMGHDIAGHYEKDEWNRSVGQILAGAIFAGVAGTAGTYQYSYQAQVDMARAMALGSKWGQLSFSKQQERESDYIASYLMVRAGYNPDVARQVWVTLGKIGSITKAGLFDSHPSGPERIAAWEKAVEEVRYSHDLLPNLDGAEAEPRLQQARIFNDANLAPAAGNGGTALAASSYGTASTATAGSGQAFAPAMVRPTGAANWIGHMPYDSCGKESYLKLETRASKLRGNMWWNGVKYDVYGKIDKSGRVRDARAGKSRDAQALPAPRFFKLQIQFTAEQARGRYALDGESAACQADFLLGRS